jgi:FtsP/CotA-like multicopper oxidase with cupredoxin domain
LEMGGPPSHIFKNVWQGKDLSNLWSGKTSGYQSQPVLFELPIRYIQYYSIRLSIQLRLGELQHAAGLRNGSDDIHTVLLHRHSFELTKFAGKATSGVMKDVVMVGGYQEVEVDFVADNPG